MITIILTPYPLNSVSFTHVEILNMGEEGLLTLLTLWSIEFPLATVHNSLSKDCVSINQSNSLELIALATMVKKLGVKTVTKFLSSGMTIDQIEMMSVMSQNQSQLEKEVDSKMGKFKTSFERTSRKTSVVNKRKNG